MAGASQPITKFFRAVQQDYEAISLSKVVDFLRVTGLSSQHYPSLLGLLSAAHTDTFKVTKVSESLIIL